MRITTIALFALGLSLVACRDTGGGSGDGDGGDDGNPQPDAAPVDTGPNIVGIKDVQSDRVANGAVVTVKGVVVTAIDIHGATIGDMFVQDPAGGAFSGVKIFRPPVAQVAGLVVGDLIDIAGAQKEEFALSSDMSGRKLTELKSVTGGTPMSITKVGVGVVPDPVMVDAAAISLLDKTAREAEWEKWEGVLITVVNARQIAAQRGFGGMAEDQKEFRISGVARVQSQLANLPADNAFGVCYERITGIGDYFFNDLVLPRSTAEMVAGGIDCRPLSTSVVETQTQTRPEAANLTGVYVTARDDIGTSKGIWVADSLVAAPNNGVFVFTGTTLAANLAVGAMVNVQGTIDEFDLAASGQQPMGDTYTEVTNATVTLGAAPVAPPTPVVADAATVSDIGAPGEAYESVLVQVNLVKVTAALMDGKVELTANGGAKLTMDDESFAATSAMGTCYASIIGVMSVHPFDNVRTINPRAASDLVEGVGCD